jgi:hypothetical protein
LKKKYLNFNKQNFGNFNWTKWKFCHGNTFSHRKKTLEKFWQKFVWTIYLASL